MVSLFRKSIFIPFMAMLACVPFLTSYGVTEDGKAVAAFYNPLEMEKSFLLFAGLWALLYVLSRFMSTDKRANKISVGLSLFFAACVVFGKSYETAASWIFITDTPFSALLQFLGYAVAFYYVLSALINFILTYDDILKASLQNEGYLSRLNGWLNKALAKNGLVKIWLVLLLCWSPYLIINYPGVVHTDSAVMLDMYLNSWLSNHHPVMQSLFWGSLVEFGKNVLGSYNAGVFLFVLIQTLYGSFITALLFDYVYKKSYPPVIIFLSFLVIAFMPAFPRNVTAVSKDSNFTLYVMLMVWLMLKLIDHRNDAFKLKLKWLLLFGITILLVAFSRKGGLYIAAGAAPFVLIHLFGSTKDRRFPWQFGAAFLIAVCVYLSGEFIIANVYRISNNDRRESYSIPFQQTARYVKYYGDEITPQERDIINAVLDYDKLADNYNPELSDPVKDSFKQDSTRADFDRYMRLWFQQFFRHPDAYIQATLNNTYGYFYPDNIGYYKDLFYMGHFVDPEMIYAPEALSALSYKLRDFNMETRKLPVIGMFSSLGFFIWSDLFLILFFAYFKRSRRLLICNIPLVMTILFCIASPVNNTMRYGLPIMFLAPILFCMCFNGDKDSHFLVNNRAASRVSARSKKSLTSYNFLL